MYTGMYTINTIVQRNYLPTSSLSFAAITITALSPPRGQPSAHPPPLPPPPRWPSRETAS